MTLLSPVFSVEITMQSSIHYVPPVNLFNIQFKLIDDISRPNAVHTISFPLFELQFMPSLSTIKRYRALRKCLLFGQVDPQVPLSRHVAITTSEMLKYSFSDVPFISSQQTYKFCIIRSSLFRILMGPRTRSLAMGWDLLRFR